MDRLLLKLPIVEVLYVVAQGGKKVDLYIAHIQGLVDEFLRFLLSAFFGEKFLRGACRFFFENFSLW